jgi:alcohol dehydrogenase (cytochrome c)
VLFDAMIDGKLRHGICEAEKTGWLYLLDRTTGKPLLPIPEKPVPQEPRQKTWPTQPIPSYAPFVPHVPNDKQVQQIRRTAEQAAGHPLQIERAKTMFTPFWKTPVVIAPGPQGGTNWQPSSYNPKTGMFYVCAQSGPASYTAETEAPAPGSKGGVAREQIGSTLGVGGGFGSNPGYFSAIDATTGRVVWQKRWPESCYAGSATTAGNHPEREEPRPRSRAGHERRRRHAVLQGNAVGAADPRRGHLRHDRAHEQEVTLGAPARAGARLVSEG